MIERHLFPALKAPLSYTPVVLLIGARQTGKSTLARWLTSRGHEVRYATMDDPATLAAAHADPAGFIEGLDGPVVLDEIQRAPGLFPAIKLAVDGTSRGASCAHAHAPAARTIRATVGYLPERR